MIRQVTAADRETYIRLASEFYHSSAVLHPLPRAHFEVCFDEMMRSDRYAEAFLFEEAGVPLGYALLAKTFSQEAGGICIWIEEIYIVSEARGKGIAHAFFTWLFENRPAARYRLETEHENIRANALYESLGFERLFYESLVKDRELCD